MKPEGRRKSLSSESIITTDSCIHTKFNFWRDSEKCHPFQIVILAGLTDIHV